MHSGDGPSPVVHVIRHSVKRLKCSDISTSIVRSSYIPVVYVIRYTLYRIYEKGCTVKQKAVMNISI